MCWNKGKGDPLCEGLEWPNKIHDCEVLENMITKIIGLRLQQKNGKRPNYSEVNAVQKRIVMQLIDLVIDEVT
jgi:hypothetical protein